MDFEWPDNPHPILNLEMGARFVISGKMYGISQTIDIDHMPFFTCRRHTLTCEDGVEQWLVVTPLYHSQHFPARIELHTAMPAHSGTYEYEEWPPHLELDREQYRRVLHGGNYYRVQPDGEWAVMHFATYSAGSGASVMFERFNADDPWLASQFVELALSSVLIA